MRKWVLVIGMMVALFAAAFATTVVTLGGWVSSPVEQKAMKAVVDAFNQQYAGQIELKYQPIAGNYTLKLTSQLSAGNAPDIFYLDSSYAQQFIRSGAIYPLDFFVKKYNFPVSDFSPSLLKPFEYNGRIYGFPKDFSTLVLFYNKKLFDKYNVAYPTSNWTWLDFLDAAEKLTHPKDGVYGLGLYSNALNRVLPFIYQNGGKLVNPDLTTALGNPEDVQAIKFYFDLHTKYKVAVSPQDVGTGWLGDEFGKEKVAMIESGPWAYSFLKENYPQVDFGVAPLPMNRKRATMIYTVCYAIPRTSKNKDAAFKAMEFLLGKGMKIFTEKLGVIPTRDAIIKSEKLMSDPVKRIFIEGKEYGHAWFIPTPSGNSSKLLDNVNSLFQEIWSGKTTVEEAMKKIVSNYDSWVSGQ